MNTPSLLQRFFSLAGARLVGAFFMFLSNLLIARYWGADALGLVSIILAQAAVLSVIAGAGFSGIATVFSARYESRSQKKALSQFTTTALTQAVNGNLILLIPSFLYFQFLFNDSSISTETLVLLTFGISLALSLIYFQSATLVGVHHPVKALMPETLLKPLLLLLGIGGIIIWNGQPNLDGLLIAIFLSTAIPAWYLWQVIRETIPNIKARAKQSLKRVRVWKQQAAPWVLTTLAWDFFIELNLLLAGVLATTREVAILHVCFRFRMLAGYGIRTLYALLIPQIIKDLSRQKDEGVYQKMKKLNLLSSLYALLILGAFILLGQMLLGLFGEEFISADRLLIIVSLTMLIRAFFGPANSLLSYNGYQRTPAVVMLICVVISLAGGGLSYSYIGLEGFAWAYTLSNLIGSCALWLICRHKLHIDCSLIGTFFLPKRQEA